MQTTEGSRPTQASTEFATFFAEVEPRLRRALVARFGEQRGRDVAVDALAYAWEHWPRIHAMENPAGYVYNTAVRAATRSLRRSIRAGVPMPDISPDQDEQIDIDPRLPAALTSLSPKQRTAVLLVHGWHYSVTEAAAALGTSPSTLRTHLSRGLSQLRRALEVPDD